MHELYKIVTFMLKHGLLKEMQTRYCLRLQSEYTNIDLLQQQVLTKLFSSQKVFGRCDS